MTTEKTAQDNGEKAKASEAVKPKTDAKPDTKAEKKTLTHGEKIDALVDLLKANGFSIPKDLEG